MPVVMSIFRAMRGRTGAEGAWPASGRPQDARPFGPQDAPESPVGGRHTVCITLASHLEQSIAKPKLAAARRLEA